LLSSAYQNASLPADWDLQDPTLQSQVAEKKVLFSSLPASDEELYSTWKRLEAHKEFLQLQEVCRCRLLLK
jgi:peptidoglycan hydrolase CwlO-like protein